MIRTVAVVMVSEDIRIHRPATLLSSTKGTRLKAIPLKAIHHKVALLPSMAIRRNNHMASMDMVHPRRQQALRLP